MGEPNPTRIYDLVYHEMYTPGGCLTEAGWLRAGCRVVGEKATQLLILHDRPHGRRRSPEEPFTPEEVAALRLRLQESEHPSDEDRRLLVRMDVAAQVSWANLYPPEAVEPITTPTQAEAWDLLSGLWRCGSHKDEFIFGGSKEDTGEKYVYTAGRTIFKSWDILDHKKGECFLGVKRGEYTRIIDIDLDRHTAAVSSGHHLKMVLDTLRFLQEHMPWASPHASNINPRNGSCHVTLYLPRAIPVQQARLVVTDIRSGCPWLANVEIYPDNCPQFLLPLRRDKVTVIDRVLTPSVKAWRKVEVPAFGKKRKKGRRPQKVRREYLAIDAPAYWCWLTDEDRTPCDLGLVEAELRKAYRGMPDGEARTRSGPKHKATVAGMAPIGRMRGRLSRDLVASWSGKGGRPDDTTATKYTTMTLRVLILVEGMSRDEAFDWVMGHLERLPNQAGDGPLVYDHDEMARVVGAAADAVAADNGYQADPEASSAIWEKVKAAWARSGFRLSDESTWNKARRVVHDDVPDLGWSPRLLDLSDLAEALKTPDPHLARKVLAAVCWQVETRSELSLSYLARIMQDLGVKGYADKAVAVRRLLEARGVIRLVKRGFRFGEDGVGNFYELAEDVEFAWPREAGEPADAAGKEVSTYPSSGGMDLRPLVRRMRRKRCIDRYHERLRGLYGGYRMAA